MLGGIALVDKSQGVTSHDVVSATRRALNTRKVGHAGTLDPLATGLLVIGIGTATRLLTHLVGADKEYLATIRLGQSSDSDDADGTLSPLADPDAIAAITDEQVLTHIAPLTGAISQIPSQVSAIKVDGKRAYDLVRDGQEVELAARNVTVSRFEVLETRRGERTTTGLEIDVVVECSSGTYIRALARDLGAALGVGGHLSALRRTRVGPFYVNDACTVDQLSNDALIYPATAAGEVLATLNISESEAVDLGHGKRISRDASQLLHPACSSVHPELAAAVDPHGRLVAILTSAGEGGSEWKVETGFPAEEGTQND